jgi:hypothetical protein
VIIAFTTTVPADELVVEAASRMAAVGWTPASSGSSDLGPDRAWTRTLGDGTTAQARLSPGTTDNGATITWDLTAYAPPHGQRASGC